MLLLLVAVLVGLAAGWLRPRVGARGVRLHLGRLPLLAVGAVGTALAQLVPADLAAVVMGLALAALLAFVATNAHVTGVVVIGLGLLLNLVAVVLNNGMPVRGGALVAAEVVDQADLATTDFVGPRHLETNRDRLGVLGDTLPVPITREVLSFGDLIVVVGAADAMRELARRRRRTWNREEREGYASTMTQLNAVHDWGTAPSAVPESGSQYSAKPDNSAPDAIDLTSAGLTEPSRPLVAATHSK